MGGKVTKAGIIGCGRISSKHIAPLRRLAGVEIVGVCDLDEGRAQEAAQRFGIRRAYRDAATMLREGRPDVVHVLTPPQSHKEVAIQAMEAGCHVLVEKPMALNLKEADEMIAAARRHRVTLGVCHNHLFDPALLKAREHVAGGRIGEVIAVETFWGIFPGRREDLFRSTPWVHELPGGFFHESVPHPVYLLLAFLKTCRVISAVSKKTTESCPLPLSDLRVLMEGESGVGSLHLSLGANPHLRFLRIYGTAMTIHVDVTNNTVVRLRTSGLGKLSKALVNLDQSLQLLATTLSNAVQVLSGGRNLGHAVLIKRYYDSIRNGTEPPVTGEEGRAVVAILDQVWAELDRTSSVPRIGP